MKIETFEHELSCKKLSNLGGSCSDVSSLHIVWRLFAEEDNDSLLTNHFWALGSSWFFSENKELATENNGLGSNLELLREIISISLQRIFAKFQPRASPE